MKYSQDRRSRKREPKEFEEKVIEVNRVVRVTKGGQRLRFRALVAIGNKKGKVGIGLGKSQEVAGAIKKAVRAAKKTLIEVQIVKGSIAHEIKIKYGSALLMLKPAPKGTSIIAGGTVRAIIALSGIQNIVSKTFGSANKINNAYATMEALSSLRQIQPKKEDSNNNAKKPEAEKQILTDKKIPNKK